MTSTQFRKYFYLISYTINYKNDITEEDKLIGDGIVIIDRLPVKFSSEKSHYHQIANSIAESLVNFLSYRKCIDEDIKIRVLERTEGTSSCRFVPKEELLKESNKVLKNDIILHTQSIEKLMIYRCEFSNPKDNCYNEMYLNNYIPSNSLMYRVNVDEITEECMLFDIIDHQSLSKDPKIALIEKIYEFNNK